ncbi:nucleoside-diphosphate sugar epimerase [Salipaludibacillus neizhouensis]|uniref:Nucleoside-diphosphate sugar epimerase n=1 Tax=Salipaludibacillus neizhouensis TaxID=885475 RepID=A0A3A9KBN4_9BACI|nr:NAD-dependent epimerase/dehydratase family protein [Salipaludibacillus neizhouensis]RKL67942.1 nucleoside-diphosphate sugar epimerase [Salipaludibacillus neizhouensis]
MEEMDMKQALVVGATGLVGRHIVKELIKSNKYEEIHLLTRSKSLFSDHPKVKEHIIDFDFLDLKKHLFDQVSDVFIAIGTTMKKVKSQEQFIKVDYTYPLRIAEYATEAGADKILLVSSMGASRNSRFFYSRVKGTLEDQILMLNHPSVHIFRPSLLTGERFENRPGERAAEVVSKPLSFIFKGKLEKYVPVRGASVASVMVEVAQVDSKGIHVYESNLIHRLGEVLKK